MKRVLLVLLVTVLLQNAYAQEKIRSKDFGYTDQVKRVEEAEYRFNAEKNKYEIVRERTLEFVKGKLVLENSKSNTVFFTELLKTYSYNEKGELVLLTEKSPSGEEKKFQYSYVNGKLASKKNNDAKYPSETVYEYNTRGQLIKLTVKMGKDTSFTQAYSDYSEPGNYTVKENTFWAGKLGYTEQIVYRNGQKQSSLFATASATKPTEHLYQYDAQGKLIEETIGGAVIQNVYKNDDRGNAFQTKLGGTPNTFRFAKIYYADGLALGTTAFTEWFVATHDKNQKTYAFEKAMAPKADVLTDLLDDLDEELVYEVMKLADDKFKVRLAGADEPLTTVKAAKSPNGQDLLIYDPIMSGTMICKNFYTNSVNRNQWLEMTSLPVSELGCYWIINSATKGYNIIKEGAYINMVDQKYKLVAQPGNTGNYLLQQNGIDKFLMKEIAGKKMDEFHPLEMVKGK